MLNPVAMVRRLVDRLHHAYWTARLGAWTMADVRADQLGLWSAFNVDDELITMGLFPWEEEILNPLVRAGQQILIIGCGSGRDMIPLLERGAAVTGVDPSPEALSALRRALASRNLRATILQGFIEDLDVPGPFDLIYLSYYCYSYIPGRGRRLGVLRKAASWLKPGGKMVVSAPPSLGIHSAYGVLGRLIGRLCRTDWRMEPGDSVWFVHGEGRGHYQHQFPPDALEEEVSAAGLSVSYSNSDAVLAALPAQRNA